MDGLVNLQELREQLERECNERQREVAAQLAWTPEREKRTHEEALRLLATWREEHVADDTIDIEVNSVTTDKDVADVQNTTGTNSDSNVQPSTAQNKAVPASSTEGRRLYIGNVAYATTKGDLKGFFKDYLVDAISIPVNPRTNRPVGYAFVNMFTASEAESAINNLNGKTILDRKVSVQLAKTPEPAHLAATTAEYFQPAGPQVSTEACESGVDLEEYNDEDGEGGSNRVMNQGTSIVADPAANIATSIEHPPADRSPMKIHVAGRCIAADSVPQSPARGDNRDNQSSRVHMPQECTSGNACPRSSPIRDIDPTLRPLATHSRFPQCRSVSSSESPKSNEGEPLRNWNARKRRGSLSPKRTGNRQKEPILQLKTPSLSTTTAQPRRMAILPSASSRQERSESPSQASSREANINETAEEVSPIINEHRTVNTEPHQKNLASTPSVLLKRPAGPSPSSASRPAKITKFAQPLSSQSSTSSIKRAQPPDWYSKLAHNSSRSGIDSSVDALLGALHRAINPKSKLMYKESSHCALRKYLHEAAFANVTPRLLRNNRMLHSEDGLPRLFEPRADRSFEWAWDIQDDAKELYQKWCAQVFEIDLLRGIIPANAKAVSGNSEKRTADRLDLDWRARHKPPPGNQHGSNGLINGQWWPTQLATVRDGAHGATQAGISFDGSGAACSVIMAGGHSYNDEDNGTTVLYCGTDADPQKPGQVTKHTEALIRRVGSKVPVRLIRSHNLKNDFSPTYGYRYDGLYEVVAIETKPAESDARQRHRFKLERCPGQTPIRCKGTPAERPTSVEVKAYKADRRFRRPQV